MQKYYNQKTNCLVCFGEKADSKFWNKLWASHTLLGEITSRKADFLVEPETKKYLSLGARILEGGCGIGKAVYRLNRLGYKAIGIDSAKETIKQVKRLIPGLPVEIGDVNKTRFPNNYFAGYWSIGVIEHFCHGYKPVIKEIKRLIKPGGYLFLTFPYMSPLRCLKARLGMYPSFVNGDNKNFYQYILDANRVVTDLTALGFALVSSRPFDGYKGIKEELNIKISHGKLVLSAVALPFAAHCVLLVFKKI